MEGSRGSIFTVASFAIFVGIVWWALGKGRKRAFDEAAHSPFALPDETALLRDARRREGGTNGTGASQ
jgi:cytochrome c oxidase cbb3-type subunit 4